MIVEPFAGSAGYATRYADREIVLVEKDHTVADLWRYLIGVSSDEIMSLPLDVEKRWDLPPRSRALVGFWCARGRVTPAKTHTSRWLASGNHPHSFWGESVRRRIAEQVPFIRHWRVIEGDFWESPRISATWFVDPPYRENARYYTSRVPSYQMLGDWVLSRRGLSITCEQSGADWLPFVDFREAKSIARGRVKEVVHVRRVSA